MRTTSEVYRIQNPTRAMKTVSTYQTQDRKPDARVHLSFTDSIMPFTLRALFERAFRIEGTSIHDLKIPDLHLMSACRKTYTVLNTCIRAPFFTDLPYVRMSKVFFKVKNKL